MTALELIYNIREKLKEYVDDTKFTDEYLIHLADLERVGFIQQKYNNIQRPVNEQLIQTFIVPIDEVDVSDAPTSKPLEETIMKSTIKLPKMVTLHHRNMLERVSSHGKLDRPFNIVSRKRFIYSGNGDYDDDQVFVTLDDNNYLLFKSVSGKEFTLDEVSVSAVLESPLDELIYSNITTINSADTLSTFKYPISSEIANLVVDTVVNKLARIKVLPSDEENNSADDATINQGNIRR